MMNEFIKNRDILDEFMRKNKLKYDEPLNVLMNMKRII